MIKQWETLEELGFKQVDYGPYAGYKFAGDLLGECITIFIDEVDRWVDNFPDDCININYWGINYVCDFLTIPQVLHKAIELKMIELGLWEGV